MLQRILEMDGQSVGIDWLNSCDSYSSVSLPTFQSSIPELRGIPGYVPASWESALSSLNGYSSWCITNMLNTMAAKQNKTPPSTRLSYYIVCPSFKVEFFFSLKSSTGQYDDTLDNTFGISSRRK